MTMPTNYQGRHSKGYPVVPPQRTPAPGGRHRVPYDAAAQERDENPPWHIWGDGPDDRVLADELALHRA